MTDRNEEIKQQADKVLAGEIDLNEVIEQLAVGSRRERQNAAAVLHIVAKADPERLAPSVDSLVDALNRPEAQTRWEVLEALTLLIPLDARACGKAIPEAETSLFDEESGPVRLAAMRFLCKIGATTTGRSEKVWPLIDEGIQCYHGDLEFNDMLVALVDFSTGKLAPEVKTAFADRMAFDAANGKGVLKRRAQQIIDNLQ